MNAACICDMLIVPEEASFSITVLPVIRDCWAHAVTARSKGAAAIERASRIGLATMAIGGGEAVFDR